ncbi:DUF2294 domain-containing protein [bacterium]|nr:DUF2294 domain-containing protein [bacterium]
MKGKSKGQLEAEISETTTKFQIQNIGKGPSEVKTHILGDIIFIRLKGALTVAENTLSYDQEGLNLVKQSRIHLFSNPRSNLGDSITEIIGVEVKCILLDICDIKKELFLTLCLGDNLEERFGW